MKNVLHWTPLADQLLTPRGDCLLLIAPFIQRKPLENFIDSLSDISSLQIITRWNSSDIVTGVSDLEIFPFLNDLHVPLYVHSSIHLKLTVFNNDLAFHTSGNITNNGLGLSHAPNIEIGCYVKLNANDWRKIHTLMHSSTAVDSHAYEQAKQYVDANGQKQPPLPPFSVTTESGEKQFSRHSLPFVQSPELLWHYYSDDIYGESRASYIHDLVLYSVDEPNLTRDEFFCRLNVSFKNHPFISSLASMIRHRRSLHFGAVNSWLTEKCSDQPVPFRWELKPVTNRLYNWLEYFFEEISWDRPNHSQVIYWNK